MKGSEKQKGTPELLKESERRRRLGLLGSHLSGQVEKALETCPSSEEMARFIEMREAGESGDARVLHHIAHCESCYAEWLALGRERGTHSRRGGGLVRLLGSPRSLAAIGSGLAAAASVAVFLLISADQDMESRIGRESARKVFLDQADGRLEAEDSEQIMPQAESVQLLPKEQGPLPAPATPLVRKQQGQLSRSKTTEAAHSAFEAGTTVPGEQRAGRAYDSQANGEMYQAYLRQLRALCLEPGQSQDIDVAGLVQKGREMQRARTQMDPDRKKQFQSILLILERLETDGLEKTCQDLVPVLDSFGNRPASG